jgi:soluble lytic murein transglycosylase-like protein
MRFALVKSGAVIAPLLILVSTSHAHLSLDPMFREAAQVADVPATLTRAIAKVESGLNPWALNIEGKSFVFFNKEQVIEKAKVAQAAGQSFDSGVMQVNNRWLSKWRIPLEEAFDPATNIQLGSRILKQEIDRYGLTWNAIGAYHSQNKARQQNYIAKVKAALGPSITVAPLRIEQTEAVAALVVERRGQTLVDRQQPAEAIFVQRFNDRKSTLAVSQSGSGFFQRIKRT